MHTRHASILSGFIALLLVGCSAGGSLITDPNLPTGVLIINNVSGMTITKAQIAACSERYFGPDRLGSSETIATHRRRSFIVSVGCWDIRLTRIDGSTLIDHGLRVNTNGLLYTVGQD